MNDESKINQSEQHSINEIEASDEQQSLMAEPEVEVAASGMLKSPPPAHENDFAEWLRNNNPLYLLSVLLMLLGLYIAGTELEAGHGTIWTVMSFFAAQNLYEFAMIGMALYLLKNQIQSNHGKLLLVLTMVFLGDLTFYQVRITGMSQLAGNFATFFYVIMSIIKFYLVVKVLKIKVHSDRIVYAFAAFALIWIGPKVGYHMVDSVGRNAIQYFDGTTLIYALWLIAGIIQLPVIINNWKNSSLATREEHEYLGDATSFWRWLMIFPFILMPLQLIANVMSNGYSLMSHTLPTVVMMAPWAFFAAFFAQALWRRQVEEHIGLNRYDTAVLAVFTLITLVNANGLDVPTVFNHILLVAGFVVTLVTRENFAGALGIGFVSFWYTGGQLKTTLEGAVDYTSGLSKTVWAAILVIASFVLLGLGFIISVDKSDKK